jgi:hypothetical protein
VNACLSFGYTLLGVEAESLILKAGLDPMQGAFPQPHHGRPSLMLDLIEEFRPVVVDSLVLRLLNKNQLRAVDFEEVTEDLTEEILAGANFEPQGSNETDPPISAGGSPAPDNRPAVLLNETGRRIFFHELGKRWREAV